jgi:hypothetical protein
MRTLLLCGLFAAITLSCARQAADSVDPSAGGASATEVALFNNTDLTGWTYFLADSLATMDDVWSVNDEGILVCTGEPWGYLRTVEAYDDYTLHLEYRWNPETRFEGNSGIFVRMTEPDKIWPRCIEAQMRAGWGGDFVLMDGMPLEADRPHPERGHVRLRAADVERPAGEWNEWEITVTGDRTILRLNGELVNEGSGSPVGPGYIGLQSEGGEVQFRNIRLTPLESGI